MKIFEIIKNISADIINIRKMFKALIHLADSQILVASPNEEQKKVRKPQKPDRVLPKKHSKHANCRTIH